MSSRRGAPPASRTAKKSRREPPCAPLPTAVEPTACNLVAAIPIDLLVLIFASFPLIPRIRIVSLVCKRWRDAVRRSITSLTLHIKPWSPTVAQAASLSQLPCLQELTVFDGPASAKLKRPFAPLQELVHRQGRLAPHPNLTHFILAQPESLTSLAIDTLVPESLAMFLTHSHFVSLVELAFKRTTLLGTLLQPHATQLTSLSVIGPSSALKHIGNAGLSFPRLLHLAVSLDDGGVTDYQELISKCPMLTALVMPYHPLLLSGLKPYHHLITEFSYWLTTDSRDLKRSAFPSLCRLPPCGNRALLEALIQQQLGDCVYRSAVVCPPDFQLLKNCLNLSFLTLDFIPQPALTFKLPSLKEVHITCELRLAELLALLRNILWCSFQPVIYIQAKVGDAAKRGMAETVALFMQFCKTEVRLYLDLSVAQSELRQQLMAQHHLMWTSLRLSNVIIN